MTAKLSSVGTLDLPLPKITMTLVVRNEEDIIEQNIRFHHACGVDSFIVMDNLSVDRTAEILNSLSSEIPIDYIYQPLDIYDQTRWVTEMARRAATDHCADWVINSDADEFWVESTGDLKSFLNDLPEATSALTVHRRNALVDFNTSESGGSHPETSVYFESSSLNIFGNALRPKVLRRATSEVEADPGDHDIGDVIGNVNTTQGRLFILHFPYRSFETYQEKIRLGGDALHRNQSLAPSTGAVWRAHRKLLDDGGLRDFWASLAKTPSQLLKAEQSGQVGKETTLRDFFATNADMMRSHSASEATSRFVEGTREIVATFLKETTEKLEAIPPEKQRGFPMLYNMPAHLNGAREHLREMESLTTGAHVPTLCQAFPKMRDAYSLFPQNKLFRVFLKDLLQNLNRSEAERLRADCANKRVILFTSCHQRRSNAEAAIATFADLDRDLYHPIILLGSMEIIPEERTPLSFAYDGQELRVPVPDVYEDLHRKLFYAYMILDLLTQPAMVIKLDDDLLLEDPERFESTLDHVAGQNSPVAGRLVGSTIHENQLHGWHFQKCNDPVVETRGYQFPLPKRYPAGGYGYVLKQDGLSACSYMYLAMKAFFSMRAIGLEDAYVGHALYAVNGDAVNLSDPKTLLCFPGLTTRERARIDAMDTTGNQNS